MKINDIDYCVDNYMRSYLYAFRNLMKINDIDYCVDNYMSSYLYTFRNYIITISVASMKLLTFLCEQFNHYFNSIRLIIYHV